MEEYVAGLFKRVEHTYELLLKARGEYKEILRAVYHTLASEYRMAASALIKEMYEKNNS